MKLLICFFVIAFASALCDARATLFVNGFTAQNDQFSSASGVSFIVGKENQDPNPYGLSMYCYITTPNKPKHAYLFSGIPEYVDIGNVTLQITSLGLNNYQISFAPPYSRRFGTYQVNSSYWVGFQNSAIGMVVEYNNGTTETILSGSPSNGFFSNRRFLATANYTTTDASILALFSGQLRYNSVDDFNDMYLVTQSFVNTQSFRFLSIVVPSSKNLNVTSVEWRNADSSVISTLTQRATNPYVFDLANYTGAAVPVGPRQYYGSNSITAGLTTLHLSLSNGASVSAPVRPILTPRQRLVPTGVVVREGTITGSATSLGTRIQRTGELRGHENQVSYAIFQPNATTGNFRAEFTYDLADFPRENQDLILGIEFEGNVAQTRSQTWYFTWYDVDSLSYNTTTASMGYYSYNTTWNYIWSDWTNHFPVLVSRDNLIRFEVSGSSLTVPLYVDLLTVRINLPNADANPLVN